MFDYVNKLQLALGDKARRTGLKVGAGVAALIGAGFLLAALWSYLAENLGLGPALASLIIGVAFLLVGLVVFLLSKSERHSMPSTDELKSEVEARLTLAADVALDKAKYKAEEAMDSAQARVHSLFSTVENKAMGLMGRTEKRVKNAGAEVQSAATDAARKVGLTPETVREAKEKLGRAKESRAAPGVGIAGAFAVGLAIAQALRGRNRDDQYDDDDYYYDEY